MVLPLSASSQDMDSVNVPEMRQRIAESLVQVIVVLFRIMDNQVRIFLLKVSGSESRSPIIASGSLEWPKILSDLRINVTAAPSQQTI